MAQPTPYDRITNFQNDQALAPTDPYPAEDFDAECNAIKITTDEVIQNLSLIQRDDGHLANASVGRDQLDPEVTIGFGAPEPWETARDYIENETVFIDNSFYICQVAHTSGVFATDLFNGNWSLIAAFTASQAAIGVAFTPSGNVAAVNVQTAIQELDTEKASIAYVDTATATLSGTDVALAAQDVVLGTAIDGKLSKTADDSAAGAITFAKSSGHGEVALTYGATTNWNVQTAPIATLTLAGNTTMAAPTNVVAGHCYHIRIVQNASSTVTWNVLYKFVGGIAPTMTTTAGKVDRYTFMGTTSNVLEEVGRAQGIA
jgi:hypothetical protein